MGGHEEIKEALLSLMSAMIKKESSNSTMQPTVFYYKEFDRDPLRIFDVINAKFHHKETLKFQLAVTEELIEFMQLRSEVPVLSNQVKVDEVKLKNPLKRSHSDDDDDVIIVQPKIPKIDLSACDSDDDKVVQPEKSKIQKFIDATEGFFSNLDNKKLQELKLSVEKATMGVTPAPLSLSDAEVEFLMTNFEKIGDKRQLEILDYLYHLQKNQPERFKMLRSPF